MTAPRHIHLIDTSIASDNVGDEIIVAAARRALAPLLSKVYVTTSAGHDGLGLSGRRLAARADLVLMLGTNALSARFRLGSDYMWRMTWRDLPALRGKVVLLGVGGNRDFDQVDWRQKRLLQHILSPTHTHSVRDALAQRIVEASGRRAAMTSCPTLWGLGDAELPEQPAPRVCLTLTKHRADPTDAALLAGLREVYTEVAFWPQQPRDLDYLRTLPGHEGVRVLPANLAAYDAHLAAAPVDVVGTRLHGTIRGLHYGRRSIAVIVDHRAREIAASSGLPVIRRDEIAAGALVARLRAPLRTRLSLPRPEIDAFLNQFQDERAAA